MILTSKKSPTRSFSTSQTLVNGCVLMVDDDPGILDVYEMTLTSMGLEPLLAKDGTEAIQYAGQYRPALIIVDQLMPGMTGLEFVKKLREMELSEIPVFVASASHNFEAKAQMVGATGCLKKPFDVEDLISLISKYVSTDQALIA